VPITARAFRAYFGPKKALPPAAKFEALVSKFPYCKFPYCKGNWKLAQESKSSSGKSFVADAQLPVSTVRSRAALSMLARAASK
jgi:hypothetical protein